MTCLWEDGIFLGVKGKSGEFKVSDRGGVWKTRTVRRKPVQERWLPSGADMVIGVPWNVKEGDPKADGDLPTEVVWPELSADERRSREEREDSTVPRRPQLKREYFEEHGWTKGCPGCKAAIMGRPSQNHTEACRKRIENEKQHDPQFKKAHKKD